LFSVNGGGNERLRTTAPEPETPMVEAHAWNERLDLSHEAMDHEHHLQIALVTAFVDAVEQRRPWLARRLSEQLLVYSTAHFGGEELLMEASGYPDREPHAREHAEFIAHMNQIERALEEGDADVAMEAALDLRQNLAAHIDDADRRLAAVARGGH
jgi:hemerythrin